LWRSILGVHRLALAIVLVSCDPMPAAAECPQCPECKPEKKTVVVQAGDKPAVDKGDLKLAIKKATRPELAREQKLLEKADIFKKVTDALNDLIAFPRDWAVLMSECKRIDAYYDAKAPGVVLCYELAEHFRGLFKGKLSGAELDETVVGATFFAFLHETGHALVHQLDLPVTGKEEDAVDQLAAVILISSGGSGLEKALDGARAFLLHSKAGFSDNSFWDEHSFEEQRYYAIVCLAYGADPKKYGALVGGKEGIPPQRAKTCGAEFTRIKKAWTKLLGPHAKA
jgi:hypothetical protein